MNAKRIAIIGTHCSGKTTICSELSSFYRKKNINIGVCEEVARKSWFLGRKIALPELEIELLGMQVSEEMRATLNYDVVLCDRSVIDIVVYSRMFFSNQSNPKAISMLKSIEAFAKFYVSTYDIIFKTTKHYDPVLTADKIRPIEPWQQQQAENCFCQVLNDFKIAYHDIPRSNEIDFIINKINLVTKSI